MPVNPLPMYETAPLAELLTVLLRQFRRPLLSHGVPLSDADAAAMATAAVEHAPLTDRTLAVRAALIALVTESEAVLSGMGLTLETSLDTPMEALPGWETTAEFLELANEKSNAELRITTGAALVMALGDDRYRPYLELLVAREAAGRAEVDLDTVIARRVLAI